MQSRPAPLRAEPPNVRRLRRIENDYKNMELRRIIAGVQGRRTEYYNGQHYNKRAPDLHSLQMKKAIATVNNVWGVYGVPRMNFSKADNDRLAKFDAMAICQKAFMDYMIGAEWEVIDKDRDEPIDDAITFLNNPNENNTETLNTLMASGSSDLILYDAATWVLTPTLAGNLGDVMAYPGPDFWIELDRTQTSINGPYEMQNAMGIWSHGVIKRYWQHAKAGIFIPFEPPEIAYFKMYPQPGSPYGTDFLSRLNWPIEYLLDSTSAAGMIFSNGMTPGGIMYHPQLTDPSQLDERIQALWMNNIGPENAGEILHLIGDEKFEDVFPRLMDMEWIEGQKYMTSKIYAMWGFSPSEFDVTDTNRASAYIAENIKKSRFRGPVLKTFERIINQVLLPQMEGYNERWQFRFKEEINLDDKVKQAQIDQQKIATAYQAYQMGIPAVQCLKLANFDKEVINSLEGKDLEMREREPYWSDGLQDPEETHTEGYKGTSSTDQGAITPEEHGHATEVMDD